MKHKRGLALFAALLLLLLYAASIVFAVIGSPLAQSLLMASLFCTIVVPAVLYGYMVLLRSMQNRKTDAGSNDTDDDDSKNS